MEDIRIYDFEFNLLHVENDIISSNWTLEYNGTGTWEGHFNLAGGITSAVMDAPYLVAVQGGKQAVVTGRQLGGDVTLFGRTPGWLLSKRAVQAFDSAAMIEDGTLADGKTETLVRYLVGQAFADVDNFTLAPAIGLAHSATVARTADALLSDVVADCLGEAKAGYHVVYDTARRQWVFELLQGSDLDTVVSEGNRNAMEMELLRDVQDCYSCGYYQYKPPKEEASPDGTGTDSSSEPVRTYLDDGSGRTGIYRWEGILSGAVESEAKADLEKKKGKDVVRTQTHDFLFGRDYALGDTVTVQLHRGGYKASARKRIVGVDIWYEFNNIGEKPVFEEE